MSYVLNIVSNTGGTGSELMVDSSDGAFDVKTDSEYSYTFTLTVCAGD